jgi:hypothetical protein
VTDTVDKIVIQAETQGVQQSTSDVQGLTKAMDGVTVASQSVEKSTGSIDSKFASLERRFGTTAGQAAQLAKVQQTVNAAVAANPALQDQANEVLAAAASRYGQAAVEVEKLGAAHGGLNGQGQAALHFVRSFGEQVALGVPITQAATGQIGHLSYAMSGEGGLAGAFSQVTGLIGRGATTLAGFVTPAIAAAGAMGTISGVAIAAGIHWSTAQTQVENALKGIGKQSGATVSDINAIAESTASSTNLSIGSARGFATVFASTGKIGKDNIDLATKATDGLAKSLGVDGADAAKLLAAALADPAKGIGELEARTGAYSLSTQELVQSLVRQGEVEKARTVLLQGQIDATKNATEANGFWAASFKAVKDGFDLVGKDVVQGGELVRHDLGGAGPTTGVSKQQQLQTAQGDLASFQKQLPSNLAIASRAGADSQPVAAEYAKLAELTAQVEKLKAAAREEALAPLNKSLKESATAADNAVNAYVPEIQKIRETEDAIKALEKAKADQAIGGTQANGGGNDAALVAAQNQLQLTRESKDEAARYNDAVKDIGQSWEGVSLKTSLQLQQLSNQLPVAQAVTGEARMQAQYYATINGLLDQGKSLMDAEAIAGAQLAISQAQSNASVEKQVQSIKDSTSMIKAQQNGTEASTAAAIAYKNAIAGGADETTAASLAAATLSNYMAKGAAATLQWQQNMLGVSDAALQAAASSQQAAQAMEDAARAASDAAGGNFGSQSTGGFGGFDVQKGTQYTSTYGFGGIAGTPTMPGLAQPALNTQNMSIDAALAAAKSTTVTGSAGTWVNGIGWVGGTPGGPTTTGPDFNQVASIYDLKNSQTSSTAVKQANLKEEMAWLQTQPGTVARDQAIVNLQKSIDTLNSSTTTLNSTMQDALSPYYSQDPRTSHIGFRSQGMSDGGYVDVPGSPSANDNTIATIPVASGERIYIDPMNAVRGKSGGAGGSSQTVNIINNITVGPGANKDQIGRTVYQSVQTASRQIQAAGR